MDNLYKSPIYPHPLFHVAVWYHGLRGNNLGRRTIETVIHITVGGTPAQGLCSVRMPRPRRRDAALRWKVRCGPHPSARPHLGKLFVNPPATDGVSVYKAL